MQNHQRRQRLGAHSEMAHPGFGHLWQQSEMSDIEIVLVVDADADPVGVGATEVHKVNRTVLQQFPGHSLLLSVSPYFAAQVSTSS